MRHFKGFQPNDQNVKKVHEDVKNGPVDDDNNDYSDSTEDNKDNLKLLKELPNNDIEKLKSLFLKHRAQPEAN